MKKKILFTLMCLFAMIAQAQTTQLKGVVEGKNGEPLIGATVSVPKTTAVSVTDNDGKFTLNIPVSTKTIKVTYIGYKAQNVDVQGKREIRVILEEDGLILNDVVVTALGIKRDKKALGYQAQDISGNEMSKVQSASPLSSLAGKVAGLNVTSSGSGPGGSVKLILRGANSITGNNEPLYVIDGVPLDNTSNNQGADRGFDYGNAANNINPDDIESISVLKGGAAAALYGSRGQNGVVMITTKQGSKEGNFEISLKSSYTFMNPMVYPKLQTQYAQGSAGNHIMSDVNSWGPKMTGQSYTNFLNQQAVMNENKEVPLKEFLQTGSNLSNTLSISKSVTNGSFYLSTTDFRSKGLIPGEEFDKLSINGRVLFDVTKFLNVDSKVNFVSQDAENRPRLLGNPDNAIYALYHMPRSIQLNQLSSYETLTGYPVIYTKEYDYNAKGDIINRGGDASYVFAKSPYVQNPYWTVNKNHNEDTRKRVLSYIKLDLDFKKLIPSLSLDKLNLMGRGGIDYYTDRRKNYEYDKTIFKVGGLATLETYQGDFVETNFDFLLSGYKQVGDFGISASLGGNNRYNYLQGIGGYAGGGVINKHGNYVSQNFNGFLAAESISKREVQSIYGMATFDYKSMLYLDVTGRNDWSSTLPSQNRSFFYPSVSGSWIVSQSVKLPEWFNYLKLRASWAEVGNDVAPHQLEYVYAISPNQYQGLPYAGLPSVKPNPNILPERTRSFETGIETRFLRGRLSADISYYSTGTKDQIFVAPIAHSSGFERARVNAGYIANKGFEMNIKGEVIKTKNLTMGVMLNLSRNFAELKELNDDLDLLTVGGFTNGEIQVRKGYAPGLLVGTAYERDADGNITLDDKNLPKKKLNDKGAPDNQVILGNCMPKWLSGFGVNLEYKGFIFDLSLDGKFGHKMYSNTNAYASSIGVLASTLEGRDEWEMAKNITAQTGIPSRDISGKPVYGSKNGVLGTYYVNPQEYYQRLNEITEKYIYDASYVRLQRISLGYRLPKKIVKRFGSKDVSVSLIASNICYLIKHTPNITPNTAFTSGTFGGAENFAYPETRSVGASIGITF